jgi:cytoskeletal protein RodZ
VKQYSRYLGLDEERVLADFEIAWAAHQREKGGDGGQPEPAAKSSRLPLIVTVTVLILAALVAGGWRLLQREPAPVEAPRYAAPAPPPPSVPLQSSAPVAAKAAEPPTEVAVDLEATASCWVSVVADGQPAWQERLAAGDKRSAKGSQRVVLSVGDAAALVVTLNGAMQPPLGGKGEVKRVVYTLDDAIKAAASAAQRP